MKKRQMISAILWILAVLWMILCFVLSWQNGEETNRFSQHIVNILLPIFRILKIDKDIFHMWLRKTAHFGVFLVTGILFGSACALSIYKTKHRYLKIFLSSSSISLFIAVVSEVGKLWIAGRHLQWDEVLLNVLGVLCGVCIVCGIEFICRRYSQHSKD